MKIHSIKFKITCWYAGIMTLLFGIILFVAVWYFGHFSVDAVEEELQDEVQDLQEGLLRYPQYFPLENSTHYFDDGVMLSIYDEKGRFVDGIFPEDFPTDYPLTAGHARNLQRENDSWLVYDVRLGEPENGILWIRGIYSYSPLASGNVRMLWLLLILFPLVAVFAACIGYGMLRRALRPVHTVTETANEITSSMSLERRISVPRTRDEIYELCQTFNRMLESLETNFLRERQFSSDAAHELRTPVSVILSHCEYCLEELTLSEELSDEIRIVQQKARQMSELVSRLLVISRNERGGNRLEMEEVDLSLLAETVAEELQEKAEKKGIRMEIENRLENAVICADMSMMTRLFINLIDNAITYGRKQGYVKVCMCEVGEQVCIKFEDNGIGISPEDQERIWDRFYQADKSHTGGENFGLGLFMVRQIASLHGGTVVVESRLAKGSIFTVTIPRKRIVSDDRI